MSAEDVTESVEVDRWKALEAEALEHQSAAAREAAAARIDPAPARDADGPSWGQELQVDEPLPSRGAPAPSDPGAPVESPAGPVVETAPAEILLADGDHAIGASIEQAMTDRGWTVRRVDTGELAIAEFLFLQPDCFVFDYGLPGIGGLDLLRRISEFGIAEGTRVVVNSAQTQTIHVRRALALGAHRFLDRPVRSPDQLVDAVADQLEQLGVAASEVPAPPAPPPAPAPAPASPADSSGGLFGGPPTEPDGPVPPAPPAHRAEGEATDEDGRSYRSAFGSGGGPPGRIPKLD